MRKLALYTFLLSVILFASCESDIIPDDLIGENIEIQLSVSNYNISSFRSTTRATDPKGTVDEQKVTDFYLFLFPGTGNTTGTLARYYFDGTSMTGGTYDEGTKKVTLSMKPTEAGNRDVYIVANVDASPSLKTALDGVNNVSQLQGIFREIATPWSDNISTSILMSGNRTHSFMTDGSKLESVLLTRAVAKVELNIKLSESFQVSTGRIADYKYRYVDFDTRTYVLKQATKAPNLASSSASAVKWYDTPRISWGNTTWTAEVPVPGSGYTTTDGKVTELRLITYLNERDEIGAIIEIELPRVDDGPLPPPEFGPELYSLPLPKEIIRNNWYVYDIEI